MPSVSSRSTVNELGPRTSEEEFSSTVDALAREIDGREHLLPLLAEDHPLYDQRGTSAIARMRGWVLLALAGAGVTDEALPFVLEELDAGREGYLVAAAARALRSYPSPDAAFAPFVLRAIGNMRFQDDAVTFDGYGAYATSSTVGTTPIRELLTTLTWLGPRARAVRAHVEELRQAGSGVSRKLWPTIDRAVEALDVDSHDAGPETVDCCKLPDSLRAVVRWPFGARTTSDSIQATLFEDQDGAAMTFADFFVGRPSIVAFFYTRCDNPQKCSLTVSKLAAVQSLLAERGVANCVRTAAITYDPGFDLPARLRAYGHGRSMRMDEDHRLLRATNGIEPLRQYFKLGVNFIESLVNRHRIEIYVLDASGRVAASFGRVHWDEREVVDRALEIMNEENSAPSMVDNATSDRVIAAPMVTPALGTMAALAVALLPKCPVCWAAYMSVLGIAGLAQIPSGWIEPLLLGAILVNVASVGCRDRAAGRMTGFSLVTAGALAIVAARVSPELEPAAPLGVLLTLAGSAVSVLTGRRSLLASADLGRS